VVHTVCAGKIAAERKKVPLSEGRMKMKIPSLISKTGLIAMLGFAATAMAADNATVSVKGYVLDSACAFTKGLEKPISKECAVACAKAGSALVILAEDGTIYWPIADTTPSSGQNRKLLPFAGEKVTAAR
jgi:hypothetical protein